MPPVYHRLNDIAHGSALCSRAIADTLSAMIAFGITDHVEGPRDCASADVFAQIVRQTELADELGFEYAWFAEHHAHAHFGHLPTPVLMALHLAGRTRQIRLGTAVVCLNLHHLLAIAEQIATADLLMYGRGAFGFGSGSTPEESALFNMTVSDEPDRHARAESALHLMCAAWRGVVGNEGLAFNIPAHAPLPIPAPNLAHRCWLAVNSIGAARIAGVLNFNMLFSHLRTPAQYREYTAIYRAAGGTGHIAANRPVHVARTDADAFTRAEPALRTLWRRFQSEGKIPADVQEPRRAEHLCVHPLNFIVGGPESVANQLLQLHEQSPYDVANVEVKWDGLSEPDIQDCMTRLSRDVRPLLE